MIILQHFNSYSKVEEKKKKKGEEVELFAITLIGRSINHVHTRMAP